MPSKITSFQVLAIDSCPSTGSETPIIKRKKR
jgi:hypothetical protein